MKQPDLAMSLKNMCNSDSNTERLYNVSSKYHFKFATCFLDKWMKPRWFGRANSWEYFVFFQRTWVDLDELAKDGDLPVQIEAQATTDLIYIMSKLLYLSVWNLWNNLILQCLWLTCCGWKGLSVLEMCQGINVYIVYCSVSSKDHFTSCNIVFFRMTG